MKQEERRRIVADVARVRTEFESLDLRLRLFRERHFVAVNGRPCWKFDGLADRASSEADCRTVERERDALIAQWREIAKAVAKPIPGEEMSMTGTKQEATREQQIAAARQRVTEAKNLADRLRDEEGPMQERMRAEQSLAQALSLLDRVKRNDFVSAEELAALRG